MLFTTVSWSSHSHVTKPQDSGRRRTRGRREEERNLDEKDSDRSQKEEGEECNVDPFVPLLLSGP